MKNIQISANVVGLDGYSDDTIREAVIDALGSLAQSSGADLVDEPVVTIALRDEEFVEPEFEGDRVGYDSAEAEGVTVDDYDANREALSFSVDLAHQRKGDTGQDIVTRAGLFADFLRGEGQ